MLKNKKYKSVVWIKKKKIKIIDKKISKLKKGEILIKIKACAICGSDIKIYNNGSKRVAKGRTIGHEISGQVKLVGSAVTKFKSGDCVSVGADIPYRKKNYAIGHEVDGGFAEFLHLNKNIVENGPIQLFSNKKLSFEEASFAEPLACCLNGYESLKVSPNKKNILIFGAGPIGVILSILAKSYYQKNKVILVDINNHRLALAKKINCADYFVNFSKKNLKNFLNKTFKNKGADIIFIAVPNIKPANIALDILASGGIINFFSGISNQLSKIIVNTNQLHYSQISLTGSHGSTVEQHKMAIKILESKKINLKPLISKKYSLDKIFIAYKEASSGKNMKILINP